MQQLGAIPAPRPGLASQGEEGIAISNLQTAQEIYQAFGRGDTSAIMDKVADDVDWQYRYWDVLNAAPWLQAQRGKAGAATFFESLGTLTFHRFVPKALFEGPSLVVALADVDATVKETGKRIVETDEVHIWHFNDARPPPAPRRDSRAQVSRALGDATLGTREEM